MKALCRSESIYLGVVPVLAVILLSTCPPSVAAAADAALPEYQVKAAYLSKFGGFIQWPPGSYGTETSPATICVVGDDPFSGSLERAAAKGRIGDRPITVRRTSAAGADSGCQILYIHDSAPEKAAQALNAVRGKGVLTVTEMPESARAAGVINFVIKDNNVRFVIDEGAAADNRLVISSQLLTLALSVKPRG